MSGFSVTCSVRIHRERQVVFQFIGNLKNDTLNGPSVGVMEQIRGSIPTAGSRYRFRHHPGPHGLEATREIVDDAPPSDSKSWPWMRPTICTAGTHSKR